MDPYGYCKLDEAKDEIRILTLLPGKFNDAIEVTLDKVSLGEIDERPKGAMSLQEVQATMPSDWLARETFEGRLIFWRDNDTLEDTSWTHPDPEFDHGRIGSLPTKPHNVAYEALSYVWGPSEDQLPVLVRDGNTVASLPIRKNLLSALQHLRDTESSRVLWIDALCINQGDDEERSNQVQRMASIYKFATRVLVWLGLEAEGSHIALSTMKYLGEQIEITSDFWIVRSPESPERDWFQPWVELAYDEETWSAIDNLLQREWFTRLWVRQEIQLANDKSIIQCGDFGIPWYEFRRALNGFWLKKHLPRPRLADRVRSIGCLSQNWGQYDMMTLFTAVRESHCTDLRDMVYGLLGVAPSGFANRLRPQYSLSVGEVYKEAFMAYLDETQRLDLIQFTFQSERRAEGPSWVTDWYIPRAAEIPSIGIFAAGVSRAHASCKSGQALEVIGIECTTVSIVSEPAPKNVHEVLNFIRKWQPEDLDKATYGTGESLQDAYVLTFCAHRTQERFPTLPYPQLEDWKNQLLSPSAIVDTSKLRALDRITTKTFVRFENGYVGLGPTAAQPGDRLSVLLGCNVPMLLRPQPSGKFLVVGACYTHGLMNCEAFLGSLPPLWSVQVGLDATGQYTVQNFLDSATGILTLDDPRLDDLPEEWERVEIDRTRHDPLVLQHFRNRVTGEVMNSDPRLLPQALKEKGVKLQTIELI